MFTKEGIFIDSELLPNNYLQPRKKGHDLKMDEFDALLEAAKKSYDSLQRSSKRNLYIRDRNILLLELLWTTGWRVSDILSVQTDWVNPDENTIKCFNKRKNNWHTISLEEEYISKVHDFAKKWNIKGFLFSNVNEPEKPMARQSVDAILKVYSKIAGIKPVNANSFRHGRAIYMLSQGMPLEAVSYRLGHSSAYITELIYGYRELTPEFDKYYINNSTSESQPIPQATTEEVPNLICKEILAKAKNKKVTLNDFGTNAENALSLKKPSPNKEMTYSILKDLEDNFFSTLQSIKLSYADETEFENHLFVYLVSTYTKKGWEVDRQVRCNDDEDRLDVLMKNQELEIAFELKIGHSKAYIRNSLGQLWSYKKEYSNIALIVLDIGKIKPTYYNEFEELLKSIEVPLLVFEGNLRSAKNKPKKATIEFS